MWIKQWKRWTAGASATVLALSLGMSAMPAPAAAATTPVAAHGQLSVANGKLVDANGKPVQLRGISSHGVQWYGNYVNRDTMKWLRDDWGISVFRVALYTAENGYISNPSLANKVKEAVAAAKELGVYIIIDWHILYDNDPNTYKAQAKSFFSEMAGLYGNLPNVIYEIANEPNGNVTWNGQIRPYALEVTQTIRAKDPDNPIIVGTGTWSQDVQDAADNQLPDKNTLYALHFYAGTHGQYLRDRLDYALGKKAAIFVTEWGTSDASGNGGPYLSESKTWLDFLNSRGVSWVNWSLSDKTESSAALLPGASSTGGWSANNLSASGKFVREQTRAGSTNLDSGTTPDSGNGGTTPDPGTGGTTPSTPTTGSLVLQYRSADNNAADNAIRPIFNIKNNGSTAVKLSDLKVRYYFNNDGKAGDQTFIDWANVGGTNVTTASAAVNGSNAAANRYVEFSFGDAAGYIPAGGQSGEVHARIHATDWSNWDENNDYSYGGTSLTDWSKMTVYEQGKLAWGVEPK
ncbi:cellulase family glycosylhydrolase [Paenibacillus campi]|uniref:cellulase family glycosylhydrolase n=1 Tax=Paenibacillus campi TaxID=3106031 RepID=UPI002AFF6482|nr:MULTISPECIES: cellulase family glycosylhydrolase [unclassified Paenibacillus]